MVIKEIKNDSHKPVYVICTKYKCIKVVVLSGHICYV